MNKIVVCEPRSYALSEYKLYIELRTLVAFYGRANRNGDLLPVDTAESCAQTLLHMPVDAKYRKIHGKDDFGGHEYHGDGIFGTENVGTHISVEIQDADVELGGETIKLPCLFSVSRIWKRNRNVCAAVRRLYEAGKLHTSYVVNYAEEDTELINGNFVIRKYAFESNTLLGSESPPAQECAGVIALASAEQSPQEIIAAALSEDIEERRGKKMLTVNDIYAGLYGLISADIPSEDFYIAYIFPEEHIALAKNCKSETELEFSKYPYSVSESDEISLGASEVVVLSVPVLQINEAIGERERTIAEITHEKNMLRETVDGLQREKAQAEAAETKKRLAQLATDCKCFSAESLANGEVAAAIASCDESAVNRLIAECAAEKGRSAEPKAKAAEFHAQIPREESFSGQGVSILQALTKSMRKD